MINRLIVVSSVLLTPILGGGCELKSTSTARHSPAFGPGAPLQLTDDNFEAQMSDRNHPVLVDFWSADCRPCLEMKPWIRELVVEFAERATIAELDVMVNPQTPKKHQVIELPAILIFWNGEVTRRLDGLCTKQELTQALQDVLETTEASPR